MSNDVRERMQEVARAIEAIIPPGTGFAVLCFDHDSGSATGLKPRPGGRLEYASNSRREDICRAMIEFIQKSAQGFATHQLERLLSTQLELDEIEKELLLYAMAVCAHSHPGHEAAFAAIAGRVDGLPLFLRFKREQGGRGE